jgi:DOMON domain/Copper type II ascorbate-dependent monooxygenase, N-terminal domain/Copper type II ascorbate-dependent monooxygenase, C-terminal domain
MKVIESLASSMFPSTSGKSIILVLCCALASQHFTRAVKAQTTELVFPGRDNEVYTTWLNKASYKKSSFLPSTSDATVGGVQIHWTVDNEMIHLAVVAQATGWVGFGLAESGSMRGADIILYTAATNTLVDSYVLDQLVKPLPDDCQSWELVNSVVDNGIIIVEAERLLNTTDTQDRTIIDDSSLLIPPTRVIAAWGNDSEPSYHGKSTARGSIRFFSTSDTSDERQLFVEDMVKEAQGNFTVSAKDFIIPSDVATTYQWFCFSREDLQALGVPMDEDLHTIGIEPVVAASSKKYVHHFILYGAQLSWNKTLGCSPDTFPGIETAYSWAPGDLPLNLPSNVGGPLGSKGFQSFALEIHYNNADLDANVSDSSGVRAFYTSIKREFDLGIFQTGDPFVTLESQIVSSDGGYAQHSFGCGGQCLGTYLNESVTVIREYLHMHMTGVSMVNYQIRNDQVIHQGRVDFWDFAQQGGFEVVQAPFQIYPGDSFRTVCNYNAANTVQWGLASQEEMCIAFLYYYPRKLIDDSLPLMCGLGVGDFLPGCNATYSVTQDFNSAKQLERVFGGVPATCPNNGVPTSPVAAPTKLASTSGAVTTSNFNIFALSVFGYVFCNVVHSVW